tara:strand:- start:410 stop:700 length:291 start_codon:yes stop_codon:yes gene_type:complete
MQPTVNVTIDKVWDANEMIVKEEAPKPKFDIPLPSLPPTCCPSPTPNPTYTPSPTPNPTYTDAAEIFKLVGASFGVGMVVGGMLVFAFSKSAVSEA